MKTSIQSYLFRAWDKVLVAFVMALATLGAGQSIAAGIADTKHNLGTGNPRVGENRVTGVTAGTGTAEICVFCHTPHGADTTAPAPLWNKRLVTGAAYTTYATLNSGTIDGSILAVGSVSLACLSCHDGAQAMDNIINAPGSGGLTADGGGTPGLGYTWAGPRVDASGMLTGATNAALLGIDLSNDHPIGIQYCGGGQTAALPTGACVDADFVLPQTALINTNRVWWVDTAGGTPGSRQRTDMMLYTRSFSGGMGPSVECGSCHDPHAPAVDAQQVAFLRVSNASSGLCLACHVK